MSPYVKLPITVLYVEDTAAIRTAVVALLSRRIESVRVAVNGREGLQLYAKYHPDIIVTDISMPEMDGLAMSREIRMVDPDAQIILVTGLEETKTFIEAIELGVDRYVLKPVNAAGLYDAIDKCAATVLRDRETRRYQEERERLIAELQEAVENVKTLSGLVPICSQCKKIRDDSGYWTQLEGYIQKHSDATFSHGICPECIEQYYPEVIAMRKKRDGQKE